MNNALLNAFAKPLLALCLLTANPILANPTNPDQPAGFQAYVYSPRADKVRVTVEKSTSQTLLISLRQKGQSATLFRHYMPKKQTQLALRLDVTNLTDGDYEVIVQSANGRIVKQLSLETSRPVLTPGRVVALQ